MGCTGASVSLCGRDAKHSSATIVFRLTNMFWRYPETPKSGLLVSTSLTRVISSYVFVWLFFQALVIKTEMLCQAFGRVSSL